jgi:hypothetical protein
MYKDGDDAGRIRRVFVVVGGIKGLFLLEGLNH